MGYDKESVRAEGDSYGEGRVFSEITALVGDSLQFTFTPLVQYDSEDRTESEFELVEDGVFRPAGTFKEMYVTWYGDSFELSAGKKVYNWGVAAGYRPTDNINPVDLLDVPTAEKLGVPALSFYKFGSKVDFELIAIPIFTPHRLPSIENRWVIIPNEADIADQIGQDPVFNVTRSLPVNTFDNLQGGFRLRSSTLADGWDLELSAFRGFDPFGLFRLVSAMPPNVNVELVYPEYWEVGGGFSTTRGKWEFHGEVAYHATKEEEQDDDYIQYVAGTTFTLDMGGGGGLDRFILTLEYLGESVTRDRPEDSEFANTGFNRVLTDTVLSRFSFVFTEDTSLDLLGTLNFADESNAYQLAVTHSFAPFIEIRSGIDVFTGDPGSFYGNWDDNDRFFFFTNLLF